MNNEALNTLARIKAAREARISETNPDGHQSEALRVSSNALRSSMRENASVDQTLADAMARLNR
ncbi:hypothetical protein BIZ78_gp004 [Erwinia phage vB_EamM_Caitlin]|uniref:hypothetical protein n=1 Tax=Erwinia phage vB_EamM_Caitlin TaxID=1883379 RepID=UPI00081C337C|nr:hypothetical protein BIZ78_gp004 [Erwinia phage vB_EamM_Caitlin]ANZ48571.1 hypothetical protein CAITLIN_276 [Erwinia phage vB_EamM_Caitlin]